MHGGRSPTQSGWGEHPVASLTSPNVLPEPPEMRFWVVYWKKLCTNIVVFSIWKRGPSVTIYQSHWERYLQDHTMPSKLLFYGPTLYIYVKVCEALPYIIFRWIVAPTFIFNSYGTCGMIPLHSIQFPHHYLIIKKKQFYVRKAVSRLLFF